ncbi:hypothetical protein B9J07_24420 [Sinorhizobium sp. LM21]|nr:hypothetical protein B9J07_24420 [Sinorhizobium sp. LM21]
MSLVVGETSVARVDERWSATGYWLICIFIVGLLIGFDLSGERIHNADIDDSLRGLQIKAFLEDGGWLRPAIPRILMPEPYISPWSRIVDLPYMLIAFSLQSALGAEDALAVTFQVWPAVMAVFFTIGVVGVLSRIAPRKGELSPGMLCAVLVLMAFAIWEFSPGRIDHHNLQMVLLLTLIYGIARFDRIGGAVVAISATISLLVGLETLPVIALVLGALALAWAAGLDGTRTMLASTAITCLVAVPILTFLVIGPSGFWRVENDAFSAPFAFALLGFGAIATVTLWLVPEASSAAFKFGLLATAGSMLSAVLLFAYPQLLAGPYAAIDDLARIYWFDRIDQEKSALEFFRTGDYGSLALLGIFSCVLAVSLQRALNAPRTANPQFAIIHAVAVALLLTALVSNRYLRFSAAVVPLLLPAAASIIREDSQVAVRRLAAFGGMAVVMATSFYFVVPFERKTTDAFDHLLWNDCKGADFSLLATLPPGQVMTPPALGLEIARRSQDSLTVSSVPFHRAAPAIGRVLRAFMSSSNNERNALLAGFDYLAVCRAPLGLVGSEKVPLFDAIMTGSAGLGLHPVSSVKQSDLIVLRIEK